MSKSAKTLWIVLILLIMAGTIWFAILFFQFGHQKLLHTPQATTVTIPPGSSIKSVADHLHQRGILKHPKVFVFIAREQGLAKKLRFGQYWIKPGMTAKQLLHNITQAKGIVRHHITFIEGWTFRQIKKALNSDPNVKHTIKGKNNTQIMQMLGHPNQHPEGRFFPDTYYFTWGNTDIDILQKAYNKMQQVLQQHWKNRATNLPYKSPYQALIVASMIEKEASLKRERPLIAGVILNRLKINMRLQVDPTVLYGLGKPYGSVITRKDLRSKTAYNTYRIYGLPPTPIDNPSASSIHAALNPTKSKYLYYVARGDGSHYFSETYKQHLNGVREYESYERSIKQQRVQEAKLIQRYEYQITYIAARIVQIMNAQI